MNLRGKYDVLIETRCNRLKKEVAKYIVNWMNDNEIVLKCARKNRWTGKKQVECCVLCMNATCTTSWQIKLLTLAMRKISLLGTILVYIHCHEYVVAAWSSYLFKLNAGD